MSTISSSPLPCTAPAPQSGAQFYDFQSAGFGITRLKVGQNACSPTPLDPGIDYLRVSGRFNSLHHLQTSLALLFDSEDFSFEELGWSAGPGATKFSHRLIFDGLVVGGYSKIEVIPSDTTKLLSDYASLTDFQRSLVADYYDDLGIDDSPDTYTECCLQFAGEFFSLLTLEQQYQYLRKLWYFGFTRCSRIDLRCDDYSFEVIPSSEMVQATLAGNVFGFSKYTPVREFNINSKELNGYGDYWGSRESSKFVRNYVHKFDDDTASIRFECEFKRALSQSTYAVLVNFYDGAVLPSWDEMVDSGYYYTLNNKQDYLDSSLSSQSLQDYGSLILHILFSVIDFRNKSDVKNPKIRDTKRLPFWEKFLSIIGGRVKVKAEPVQQTSLPSCLRWFWKQCGNTVATIVEGIGWSEFQRMMELVYEYSIGKLHTKHLEYINLMLRFPNVVNDLGGDVLPF